MAIYLDHAATTPIRPEVKKAMLPFLDEAFGNPSSIHQYGRTVRTAIDQARQEIAHALHTEPGQITFTSGGTEADNLAIMGVATACLEEGKNHIITSEIEHHAVLDTCKYMERVGFEVTYLPVDHTGMISIDELKKATRPNTCLISIMTGNNEVGTLQPIEEMGQWAQEQQIYFHTDAVQAFGVEELDLRTLPVDLLSLSSHKINGPKGVGALYQSKRVRIIPRNFGGAQERRRRPGTENVIGIVGFGKATELAMEEREEHKRFLLHLRHTLLAELKREKVNFVINGHPERFLPHILNLSFPGTDSETLLMNYDIADIACASGSACTSGTLEVSHVLKAMQLSEEITRSAIRFSFGRGNTVEQMRGVAKKTAEIVRRLTTV
ncbi:cysteine desulfurase family protein [Hazenella coriacea]|uniref:cysteine desulfurase n=1 Tax=Hazenella coriacea TaxID=1179467 RepID=A0A4R3L660_9BACL|nr:cysteine desulfurase family protein [Hazenella coriacea]TCS94902.1 cysteine desulfurase [Hazenella coriacea]